MIIPQSGSIDKWLAAYGTNLQLNAHANIMSDGVVIADYPVETFTITLDSTAAAWRQTKVSIAATGLVDGIDTSWMDVFNADGNEIRLWWEQTFSDGSKDEVCCGTFTIVETLFSDSGTDVTVDILGYDRSWLLKNNKLVLPYAIDAGLTVDQAITKMLSDNWDGSTLSFNITPTSTYIPATSAIVKPGKDVWTQAQALAASIGYLLHFDVWGNVIGMPIPNPSGENVLLNLDVTSTNAVVLAIAKSSRKKVFSQVGVIGNGPVAHTTKKGKLSFSPTTIYGSAQDNNPLSPTFIGHFGKVGTTIRSTAITTAEQAQAAAQAYLDAQLGAFTASEISILPFPLLDAYDTVYVNAPRVGLSGKFIVSGWTGTMHHSGVQTLTLRQAT